VEHGERHVWMAPESRVAGPRRAHLAALGATFLILGAFVLFTPPASTRRAHASASVSGELTITPGDAEIERGSAVVVTARFGANPPGEAKLRWSLPAGERREESMVRSLSDPVFAFTLPALQSDLAYQIIHDRKTSPSFKLTVFDLPALVRADASLDFPDYTGLPSRRVEDTRRVSAVQGTQLIYRQQAAPARYIERRGGRPADRTHREEPGTHALRRHVHGGAIPSFHAAPPGRRKPRQPCARRYSRHRATQPTPGGEIDFARR
jgi:hypothetical protein